MGGKQLLPVGTLILTSPGPLPSVGFSISNGLQEPPTLQLSGSLNIDIFSWLSEITGFSVSSSVFAAGISSFPSYGSVPFSPRQGTYVLDTLSRNSSFSPNLLLNLSSPLPNPGPQVPDHGTQQNNASIEPSLPPPPSGPGPQSFQ